MLDSEPDRTAIAVIVLVVVLALALAQFAMSKFVDVSMLRW